MTVLTLSAIDLAFPEGWNSLKAEQPTTTYRIPKSPADYQRGGRLNMPLECAMCDSAGTTTQRTARPSDLRRLNQHRAQDLADDVLIEFLPRNWLTEYGARKSKREQDCRNQPDTRGTFRAATTLTPQKKRNAGQHCALAMDHLPNSALLLWASAADWKREEKAENPRNDHARNTLE